MLLSVFINFLVSNNAFILPSSAFNFRSRHFLEMSTKPMISPEDVNLSTLGVPRVIRRIENGVETFLMWFQGRESSFDPAGELPKLSTGRIFFCESTSGLGNWKLHEDNPVINPNKEEMEGDWWFFDSEHVGLGDVITPGGNAQNKFITQDGVFLMYTYGGNSDTQILGENLNSDEPAVQVKGARFEIGVCVSQDGAHWSRVEGPNPYGSILEPGSPDEFDGQLVGWPTVVEVGSQYNMYYSTYNPHNKKFTIGMAQGKDALKWDKKGPVLNGGSNENAFDFRGCSRRDVHKMPDGTYRMWYEGVSKSGTHSIGIATSSDGTSWQRLGDDPIFAPSSNDDDWDNGGVGSPHLMFLPERNIWRMYYIGNKVDENEKLCIGVAESSDSEGVYFKRIE